jgi:hypothetical protein
MRNTSFIIVFLILASCTTQRFATTSNLSLKPLNNDTVQIDKYHAKVNFIRLNNQNYEFSVFIKNNSKDTVSINPSLFSYNYIPNINETNHHLIYSINPKERIKKLESQKDSLMKEKNPYSLAGKSTKEIVKNGLIQGTVATLFGQDPKKWESQREEDEYYWEQNHNYQLNKMEKELDFWNNDALLPQVVAPNNKTSGKVLFPVSMNVKAIQVRILIQNDTLNYRFIQSD